MSNWKTQSKKAILSVAVLSLSIAAMTGCGSSTPSGPTPQGTLSFEAVKVGMPEDTFKAAMLSFVLDPKGSIGGWTQYLSRNYDESGGQYVVHCKDSKCTGLEAYYFQNPVSKEVALKKLQSLLPADAPPQSKVDDSKVKSDNPTEVYFFGDKYKGNLIYTDKSATQVKIVNAFEAEQG